MREPLLYLVSTLSAKAELLDSCDENEKSTPVSFSPACTHFFVRPLENNAAGTLELGSHMHMSTTATTDHSTSKDQSSCILRLVLLLNSRLVPDLGFYPHTIAAQIHTAADRHKILRHVSTHLSQDRFV